MKIECLKSLKKDLIKLSNNGVAYSKSDEEMALEIIKMNPDYYHAYELAGNFYHSKLRYEEAIVWFEKTLQIDPERSIAYINLGDAYLKVEKLAQAQQVFERYLVLAPSGRSANYAQEKIINLTEVR